MADFESALSELGAVLAATDAKLSTSLAEILGVAIQELIEAELTALIGRRPGASALRPERPCATGTDPSWSRPRPAISLFSLLSTKGEGAPGHPPQVFPSSV